MVDGKRDGVGAVYVEETEDLIYCYWRDDKPWSRVRAVSNYGPYSVVSEIDSSKSVKGSRFYPKGNL